MPPWPAGSSFLLFCASLYGVEIQRRRSSKGLWIVFLVVGLFFFVPFAWFVFEDLIPRINFTVPVTPRPEPTLTPLPTEVLYDQISWVELEEWLASDHTNLETYQVTSYTCLNFSIDLVKRAKQRNINAWVISVDFYNQENGHAFVAFETTDRGVVYFEPQADVLFAEPVVGRLLCEALDEYVCMDKVTAIWMSKDCESVDDCEFILVDGEP